MPKSFLIPADRVQIVRQLSSDITALNHEYMQRMKELRVNAWKALLPAVGETYDPNTLYALETAHMDQHGHVYLYAIDPVEAMGLGAVGEAGEPTFDLANMKPPGKPN